MGVKPDREKVVLLDKRKSCTDKGIAKAAPLADGPNNGQSVRVRLVGVYSGFLTWWDGGLNALDRELHIAAHNNDVQQIEELIKKGANVNAKDAYGMTPRQRASKSGIHPGAPGVELLKKHGAPE